MRTIARVGATSRVSHLDKWFFAVCAVGGAVVIAAVDYLDGSKWTAVGACVAIMVLYAVGALRLPGLKLRADQAADNLYYLGLLYTLVSLGVALIRFTSSEQATDAILRNFGIAIFTTIVGLGLRVFVGQFREDVEESEQEARAALSETVRRMRRELDLSVAELRSFADGMRQVVNEFTQRANTSTVETLEQAVNQFERAAASMGARFETSADQFSGRVQAFEGSLERVVGALEGLMERVGAVRADPDILERGMRPALERVEQTVEAFATSVAQEQARFEAGAQAVVRFNEAASRLGDAGEVMSAAAIGLREAGGALGDVTSLVQRLEAAAAGAARASSDFSERLEGLAERTEARHAESIQLVQRAASEAARAAAGEAEARLQALEAAARRVIETLNGLDREFAGSGESVVRVRRELAELAGWIITRLER